MRPASLAAGAAAVLAGAACGVPASTVEAAGAALYRPCRVCHSLEPEGDTPAGPSLDAIVGRPVAARPGFVYSRALRKLATAEPRWTPDLLDRFLADPQSVAPGSYMSFPGMTDPEQRRILIGWLERSGRPAD